MNGAWHLQGQSRITRRASDGLSGARRRELGACVRRPVERELKPDMSELLRINVAAIEHGLA
jgi:hypothetical protein